MSRAAKRGVTPLAMILAGLQRARLRAERLDADGAELRAELATVLPLPSNELNKGLTAIGDKRAGWELLRMLEKTLSAFCRSVPKRTSSRTRPCGSSAERTRTRRAACPPPS